MQNSYGSKGGDTQNEEKKTKVKKGWIAVEVGMEDEEEDDEAGTGKSERFVVPISDLHHPLFKQLLDKAQDIYGYHTSGPLRLPCSVDDFLHLRWRIEKESHLHHRHHHHHHLPIRLSFNSC